MNPPESLKYLNNRELREQIAYAVGADPSRYSDEAKKFTKSHVQQIAQQLQPEDNDLDVDAMALGDIYEAVCDWAGGDYSPNAGKPWGINRENLKLIHTAVDGREPREVIEA